MEFRQYREIWEIYKNGHVDLLFSTCQDRPSDVAIIKEITLKDNFYASNCGLRVGDNKGCFLDLYAGNNFSGVLVTTILTGFVSRISLS